MRLQRMFGFMYLFHRGLSDLVSLGRSVNASAGQLRQLRVIENRVLLAANLDRDRLKRGAALVDELHGIGPPCCRTHLAGRRPMPPALP